MEGVHGVDISWLHHANRASPAPPAPPAHRQRTHSSSTTSSSSAAANGVKQSPRARDSPASSVNSSTKPSIRRVHSEIQKGSSPAQVTPASIPPPKGDDTNAISTPAAPLSPAPAANGMRRAHSTAGRPQTLTRNSSDRSTVEDGGRASSRRPGWINNLSSKFSSSSQSVPTRANQQQAQPLKSPTLNYSSTEEVERVDPYVPSKPKEYSNSFFSSLTRRLSAASQTSTGSRANPNGTVCPRKVLNIDRHRERCLIPELDNNKLRKVSFCVDVEIAGGPKYKDEPEDELEKKRKRKDAKLKERAEGEALKNPNAVSATTESTHADAEYVAETRARSESNVSMEDQLRHAASHEDGSAAENRARDSMDGDSLSRKKEKKKRSEMERKERKEQRLRRAQESGQIPIEFGMDDDDDDDDDRNEEQSAQPNSTSSPKTSKSARPTTDPARIYRRCCQLRETPILKRITEQLMSPKTVVPGEPGVVSCLDLTGSRMQLPDVVTLGDWLAVVPVKRLLLEDADLNDEGVRVVLAGLLAAKKPELTRRKSMQARQRNAQQPERSGIVEKVTFKNNPRITRLGWKHISLFIYMCRSIKAIDLSMNKFPDELPTKPATTAPARESTPDVPNNAPKESSPAEILFKCLAERLCGNRLEELSVSECSLRADHIRKIIDGVMICGVSRLGLAGNDLNDAGLDHVMHYLKSGLCHGIDLGGNNLRGKLDRIADSLVAKPSTPCWGLSLADCNLDAASVKPLLPALVSLPNFRFIDLSHNRDLCTMENSNYNVVSLFRRYLGQLKNLKRIHLNDVGMTSKQAISLAEVLPEGLRLAHVSVLKNPQLTALANGTDETSQEEACALYASFMIAVRCSKTLICIDIDVPSADSSEVVKALAKQVVAYSLRNMEEFAIAEATGDTNATTEAATQLAAPHGGTKGMKAVSYPDVLMHLVGHVDGLPDNHDNDEPAPDDDYIVGGTGVVRALQYVLGEKANDIRRTSAPGSPAGGLPRDRPGSSAGLSEMGKARAKQMSRQLLESARKIRTRLQPAIVKEATAGDEMAWRRLQFLDQTLQSMISRFEEEYPETRVQDSTAFQPNVFLDKSTTGAPGSGMEDEVPPNFSLAADDDDDDAALRSRLSRHNSDASLASRSMTLEEGRLHRKGQHLRREVINSSAPASPDSSDGLQIADDQHRHEKERLRALAEKLESISGEVLGPLVDREGWAAVLGRLGANYDDLRAMQQQDPEGWEQLIDAQMKAKMNVDRNRTTSTQPPGPNMF